MPVRWWFRSARFGTEQLKLTDSLRPLHGLRLHCVATEEQNKHGDWDSEGDRGRSRYVHTPPPLTQQPYEEDDILDPLINVDHIQQCNADERARCGNGADSCSKVNGDIKCQYVSSN